MQNTVSFNERATLKRQGAFVSIGRMSGQLTLVVMSRREGVVLVPILWERPELVIGRDPDCDVCLVDNRASRRHARLTRDAATGAPLITDLGSRNGTTLDGRRLEPSHPTPLAEGSIVRVGDAVMVLEERRGPALRRVAPGEAFALRVDAEITRASAEGTTFSLVEIGLEGGAGAESLGSSTTIDGREGLGAALVAERAFARAFRDEDVLASFGDGVWRALLPKTAPAEARQLLARLRLLLEESGQKPALRWAHFPRHGVTSKALTLALGDPGDGAIDSSRPPPAAGVMAGLGPMVDKVAPSPANVLLFGETGVGKEVLARAIHERSARASRPLVCLNCAALAENLLESELFGHERGAFTTAVHAKPGLLEAAEDGTVLFDEIGEMPLNLQAKLLRVLEAREATRLGGLKPRPIRARFIFATHRDLEREVEAGRFRQDLYFRINTIAIEIPPLRERKGEIAALAAGFITHACEAMRLPDPPRLSPQALALLETYHWPGNVRELRNVIDRAVVLCVGPLITLEHLPLDRFRGRGPAPTPPPGGTAPPPVGAGAAGGVGPGGASSPPGGPGASPLTPPQEDERARIVAALERSAYNQSKAKDLLGMSRRTLVSRMTQYGLPRPRKGARQGAAPGADDKAGGEPDDDVE